MSNNYFWQGGRKIEIEQTESDITLQVPNVQTAETVAKELGIGLESTTQVGPGLVRASLAGDRDQSMANLRAAEQIIHHVYRTPGETDSEYLITDSFFVKFRPETPAQDIQEFLDTEKLELVQEVAPLTLLVRVTNSTNKNAIKSANLAAARRDVEYAEPNLVHQLKRFAFLPADSLFAQQWHLHAPADGRALVAGADIDAPEAWQISRGSRDIVICVADDGFDLTHPDFQGAGKVVGQLNAALNRSGVVAYTNDVTPQAGDYHGTPCAGVALAEINGQGTVGVAPGCAFLAVRFPLSFSDAAMIQLFQRISRDADVVSCSWGFGPTNQPLSRPFYETLSTLARTGGKRGKGLVICVAAGNNNCPVKDLNNRQTYQFLDDTGRVRSYSGPIDRWIAAHPDVITVSGSTSLQTRSAFSSWGEQICVCAPTNNFDDLNRIATTGRGIVTTDNETAGEGFTQNAIYTDQFGGTSSATPTVAGVCGLILSVNPNLTALEVKKILQNTADKNLKIESETPVNRPGDFVGGFSLWFGHGKVNAAKALQAAIPANQQMIDLSVQPNLTIPDAGITVTSTITIANPGKIDEIRIGVDVAHTYIGDLRIDITSPEGVSVTLHDHKGGSTDNLQKVFTVADIPALQGLQGRAIQGTWTLSIVDSWRMDIGSLKAWRILAKVSASNP
jgi:subtilisin-like proprotein convertase family protein